MLKDQQKPTNLNEESSLNDIEIYASNLNLFEKSTLWAALATVGEIIEILKAAGYDGMEWFPIRATLAGTLVNFGYISEEECDYIIALHESYRAENSLIEAWKHPNRKLALLSYLLLPQRRKSLDSLKQLQKIFGKKLPIVLYPEHDAQRLENEGNIEPGTQMNFGEKTFQPTPQIMRDWNVHTVEELIAKAKKKGYDGFCIDLTQMRAGVVDGFTLDPWKETLSKLLAFAKEVHISVGRLDLGYGNTVAELMDLINGTEKTEIFAMIDVIRNEGFKGRVVVEIPAAALHGLNPQGRFMSKAIFIDYHRAIVENIRKRLSRKDVKIEIQS